MKKLIINAIITLNFIIFFPHIIIFLFHRNRRKIHEDVSKWINILFTGENVNIIWGLIYFITFFPEFRNIFYKRIGFLGIFLNVYCRKMSTLYINTPEKNIAGGLFIQHGFATIISAKSIGNNAWINQQVTIGYSNSTDCPTLLDNIVVYAGAKIIGDVTIGNNSKVGANAVVVKNIPDNCTVVGVPAFIVRRDGIKCKERL